VLYFSRTKIITVVLISILFSFFTLSNFTKFDDNLFNKKINLGLDLQGGSYLLLEIDNEPVVVKNLQNKATLFKNYFKEKKIKLFNLRVTDTKIISFNVDAKDVEKTNELLEDKEEGVNPYYERFKTYQYDVVLEGNKFELKLSKYGLGLGTFIGKTLLEKNKARLLFRNSETRGGAEIKIEWLNKNLADI